MVFPSLLYLTQLRRGSGLSKGGKKGFGGLCCIIFGLHLFKRGQKNQGKNVENQGGCAGSVQRSIFFSVQSTVVEESLKGEWIPLKATSEEGCSKLVGGS